MDHGSSICPRRSPDCLFDDTLSGGGRRRGAKRSAVPLRPGVPVGLGGGQHYPQRSLYLPSGHHWLVLDLVDGRGGKRPSRSSSEERRVGKECVRPCIFWWWPVH